MVPKHAGYAAVRAVTAALLIAPAVFDSVGGNSNGPRIFRLEPQPCAKQMMLSRKSSAVAPRSFHATDRSRLCSPILACYERVHLPTKSSATESIASRGFAPSAAVSQGFAFRGLSANEGPPRGSLSKIPLSYSLKTPPQHATRVRW